MLKSKSNELPDVKYFKSRTVALRFVGVAEEENFREKPLQYDLMKNNTQTQIKFQPSFWFKLNYDLNRVFTMQECQYFQIPPFTCAIRNKLD